MTGPFAEIAPSGGVRIVAEARHPWIRVRVGEAELDLPFPRRGLGGGELIVSPSGRFCALGLYSGQSEEGYELFEVGPPLRHIGGLPYESGEAASYAFAPGERHFAMLLPLDCVEWWSGGEDGTRPIPFAELRVHDLRYGEIAVVPVDVAVPDDWRPSDEKEWTGPRSIVEFLADDLLRFQMPWRRMVEVPLGSEHVVVDR
jgi:hypothetical protein